MGNHIKRTMYMLIIWDGMMFVLNCGLTHENYFSGVI